MKSKIGPHLRSFQIILLQLSLLVTMVNAEVTHSQEEISSWRKAAALGIADAQYNLGLCYGHGEGLKVDHGEAVKWFKKAAEQGHLGAQYALGIAYKAGLGTAADPTEAVRWFRKVAEQGHAKSQYCMGLAYKEGTGIAKDPVEAARWFMLAAGQNHVDAQFELGLAYSRGDGVLKDLMLAKKWYRKAHLNRAIANAKSVDEIARLQESYDEREKSDEALAKMHGELSRPSSSSDSARNNNLESFLTDLEDEDLRRRQREDSDRLKRIERELQTEDIIKNLRRNE